MYEKYVNIVEALNEAVEVGALTVEDANIINDLAYENYLTEGSNSDARQVLKDLKPKYKRKMADARRAIRAGENKKATAILRSLDTEVRMAEKELEKVANSGNKVDQTVSAILGAIYEFIKTMAENLCINIIGMVGTTAAALYTYNKSRSVDKGADTVIKGGDITKLVRRMHNMRKVISTWSNPVGKLMTGEQISISDFNACINNIRSKFKFMHEAINSIAIENTVDNVRKKFTR